MTGLKDEFSSQLKEFKFVCEIDKVIELRKQFQNLYANEFSNGCVGKARKELEARMKGNRNKDIALISFNLGVMMCLIFVYFLLAHLDSKFLIT
jgi:hypothetical protein